MSSKKILIAYTTNAGTTADVAKVVENELTRHDLEVEVRRLEEVANLEPYCAVIIGGPMIMGWHKAALKFIKAHQVELSQLPVAYFITAMRLTDTGETNVEAIPISIDPNLAKPPKKPGRLSFKERYATVGNYLRSAIKAAPSVDHFRLGSSVGNWRYTG